MVDVGVGEDGAGDGRVARGLSARLFARMKLGPGFDLCAQIGRGSEQEPVFIVIAHGNLRLGARFAFEGSGAQGAAVGAGAVPLGERASGGRA